MSIRAMWLVVLVLWPAISSGEEGTAVDSVRTFLVSMRGLDAKGVRGAVFCSNAKAAELWVSKQMAAMGLEQAAAPLMPKAVLGERVERSLAGLEKAVVTDRAVELPQNEEGGFLGTVEKYPVMKVKGAWKINLDELLGMGPADYLAREQALGADEEVKGMKLLTARLKGKKIITAQQFNDEVEELHRHVMAVVEERRLAAEEARHKAYEAWRLSDEGKAALAKLTAGGTRLQLRMVLGPDDPAASEELKDGRGDAHRVAKEVLLNEHAVASAKVEGADGANRVLAKLNEAGARQMEWVTANNIGRRLAIVLDGKVIVAPVIRATIREAIAIDGGRPGFSAEEAQRVVGALLGGR